MFDSHLANLLAVIVGLPLAAVLVTALLGARVLRSASHVPTVLALLGSFTCSLILLREVQFEQAGAQANAGEVVVEFADVTPPIWNWASVAEERPPARALRETAVLVMPGVEIRQLGVAPASPPSPPKSGTFSIDITLRADALTSLMLAMVTFVSLLVAIYSIGYMRGDRSYWRFFTYISLFVFSMCMLVTVSNFLLLYVFWEAVGVCSYLLIGYWYERPAAAAAGKKAFLVNRVGDFGFALAIFLIWLTYGTLDFHDTPASGGRQSPESANVAASDSDTEEDPRTISELSTPARIGVFGKTAFADPKSFYKSGPIAFAICVLLMLGACGKSAQFPLHVWLPDAMEGPTPVSALIHAATMVTAGVYMVARCAPLFMASPAAQLVVACIGGFTALLAALIALTQWDLKRVLAYSTISQLGYMFLALGCGTFAGISAGMFHLLTHAFFKALLFLGAGSVMHAMGGVIDMRRFGGLRSKLWITCITFAIGCYALAGLPFGSGFFSKDAILAAVQQRGHEGQPWAAVYTTLFWAALFTAGLTAFYAFRAFFLTFFGKEVVPEEAGHHAYESPPVMWLPLAALALLAAVGGVFGGLYAGDGSGFLVHTPSLATGSVLKPHGHFQHGDAALLGSIAALLGTALASYLYLGHHREIDWLTGLLRFDWLARFSGMPWVQWLASRSAVQWVRRGADAIYLGWLARLVGWVLVLLIGLALSPLLIGYYISPYNLSERKFYFDEIYSTLIVRPLAMLAGLSSLVDNWLIDGLVNFLGWLPRAIGALLRTLQMGLVPFYALAMALGIVVMLAALVLW